MSCDETLAARIRQCLSRRRNIEEKRMFGGTGFLLKGHMLVGVWKTSLVARVGPEQYQSSLREPSVSEFNITGRSMTGWVLVSSEALQDEASLSAWIECCLSFVRTLPAK